MRKILLMLMALVICFTLNAEASRENKIAKSTKARNDLLADSVTFYNKWICTTSDSNESEQLSPVKDGLILNAPDNDDCGNATAINEVDSLLFSMEDAMIDGGNISLYPNVWFLYTATVTDRVRISTDNAVTTHGSRITIYDGTTCPEYIDMPTTIELQGGEAIEDAIAITDPLPVEFVGTLAGYELNYWDCSCMTAYSERGPDAVYSYTAAATDSINFFLRSVYSTVVLLILDEDGNELACANNFNYRNPNDGSFGPTIYNFPVVEGETYYIIVSAYYYHANDSGDYTLTIYSPNEIALGSSTHLWASHDDIIFDAVAGNQYLIEVMSSYEESYYLSVGQIATPVNDACEDATDGGILGPGEAIQFTGDNIGATTDCWMISSSPYADVWVKFTTEDTLDIKLDYCGTTTINGKLAQAVILSENYCPCISDGWFYGEIDENNLLYYCPNRSWITYWYDLPPGIHYFPMIVHYWWEGPYVINVSGITPQSCNDDALFGQAPIDPTLIWAFYYSDLEAGYSQFDKIEGIESPINEITWWGIYTDQETQDSCDPNEPCSFQIVFCNYDNNSPNIPADTIAIYNISVAPEEPGYLYGEYFQKKFVATLPQAVELDGGEGWIMIRGNDGNSNNCSFAWQNSSGNGSAVYYDDVEGSWTRNYTCMAFCLGYDQTAFADDPVSLPSAFELSQNYPNPFNATTSIQFSLKESGNVELTVYDINGRKIKSLYSGMLSAGSHKVIWDSTNESGEIISSGIYFYNLKSPEGSLSKRMVFLK